MLYIKEKRKQEIKKAIDFVKLDNLKLTTGDINYLITMLIRYVRVEKINYEKINSAAGILLCSAIEFYQREVIPYEDKKRKENEDDF